MNVGELFVGLGVKGSEKTMAALGGMRSGLRDISSTSLETKAALVGVMYALERMFSQSGKAGTNLTNFNAVLGTSAKTLQQYQYAARQAGVSNEEVEGTFKSLQSTMTKTLMGEGAPKGLARVAQLTGNMTAQDIKRFAEAPELLIQKLQEYAAKETNTGLRNEVLKSFGVNDSMIAALNRKAFTPQQLAKAPTYSEGEVKSLDRANIAWSNLGNKIEMAFGRFNAKHGGEIVTQISQITDKVLKMVEAFTRLAESTKAFEWVGKIFEGWGQIFEGVADAVDTIKDTDSKDPKKAQNAKNSISDFFSGIPSVLKEVAKDVFDMEDDKPKPKTVVVVDDVFQPTQSGQASKSPVAVTTVPAAPRQGLAVPAAPNVPGGRALAPAMSPGAVGASSTTQDIKVNQTLNFNGQTDPKQAGDVVKKAVKDAYRQTAAQGQGS